MVKGKLNPIPAIFLALCNSVMRYPQLATSSCRSRPSGDWAKLSMAFALGAKHGFCSLKQVSFEALQLPMAILQNKQ